MNDQRLFSRISAISAILSAILMIAGVFLVSEAVDFDFEIMSDQASLIGLGTRAADLMSWGEFLAVFGGYLLYIPVALYLWEWLKPKSPNTVTLYTVAGLGYVFIGVPGAILRANVLPEMMRAYTQASAAQQEILAVVFKTTSDVIFAGLGVLEPVLIGVWLLGIGLVLRSERRLLGIVAAGLGSAFLISSAGTIFHIAPLILLENLAFTLIPFWVLWLGIVIWQGGKQGEQMQLSAMQSKV